jgi:hypothetical protein
MTAADWATYGAAVSIAAIAANAHETSADGALARAAVGNIISDVTAGCPPARAAELLITLVIDLGMIVHWALTDQAGATDGEVTAWLTKLTLSIERERERLQREQ